MTATDSRPHGPAASRQPAVSGAAAVGRSISGLFRLTNKMKAHLAATGQVDWTLFPLLVRLEEHGELRVSALAESVHADISTVSRHVAALVELGWVEKRRDPDDGRASTLAITQEGLAAVGRNRNRRDAMIREVVADWDPADVDRLAALLARLVDGMTEQITADHKLAEPVARPDRGRPASATETPDASTPDANEEK
ncbi:MAG TPA: MarR family winged helix-turn-helix transcriptional regulator [Motilibacteraceae bacterium]|nr:MarR family winged helix-turn-helix transcriptional regulator [Motilibacteraceae bacterium]